MAKKIKQYRLLIGLFVIYWGIIYSNWIIKVNSTNYTINLVQILFLFTVFINIYFLFDLLFGKKMNVYVLNSLGSKKANILPYVKLKVNRCFFAAVMPTGREIVLSKINRRPLPFPGLTIKVYYSSFNKGRVIDKYIILIRIIIIILSISVLLCVKYLEPRIHGM